MEKINVEVEMDTEIIYMLEDFRSKRISEAVGILNEFTEDQEALIQAYKALIKNYENADYARLVSMYLKYRSVFYE